MASGFIIFEGWGRCLAVCHAVHDALVRMALLCARGFSVKCPLSLKSIWGMRSFGLLNHPLQ